MNPVSVSAVSVSVCHMLISVLVNCVLNLYVICKVIMGSQTIGSLCVLHIVIVHVCLLAGDALYWCMCNVGIYFCFGIALFVFSVDIL